MQAPSTRDHDKPKRSRYGTAHRPYAIKIASSGF